MHSGELGRRRRASRELKWVGAYSEARVPTLPGPKARRSSRSSLWVLGLAGCEAPSLTIGAGSRTSLPTPRGVALPVAYRLVSHFVNHLQQLWSKCPGGLLCRPRHVTGLPRFRASSRKYSSSFTSHPVTVPPGPGSLWATLGGAWGLSILQTDLVGTCQTHERRCPLLAFRNSGNALCLAQALHPYHTF